MAGVCQSFCGTSWAPLRETQCPFAGEHQLEGRDERDRVNLPLPPSLPRLIVAPAPQEVLNSPSSGIRIESSAGLGTSLSFRLSELVCSLGSESRQGKGSAKLDFLCVLTPGRSPCHLSESEHLTMTGQVGQGFLSPLYRWEFWPGF